MGILPGEFTLSAYLIWFGKPSLGICYMLGTVHCTPASQASPSTNLLHSYVTPAILTFLILDQASFCHRAFVPAVLSEMFCSQIATVACPRSLIKCHLFSETVPDRCPPNAHFPTLFFSIAFSIPNVLYILLILRHVRL